jgi:parallel beta-helix repeat protein
MDILKIRRTLSADYLHQLYGCQMLNLLGNNNVVRGNILSRLESTAECLGILFEWDLSDANLIEGNRIINVLVGIAAQGGDGNIIQNNEILASPNTTGAGVQISSYDNRTDWTCNDYAGSGVIVARVERRWSTPLPK